jgi:hypothetical protein
MSTSHRQQRQLRRMAARLRRSDPDLDAMFGIFGRLYRGQELAACERESWMRSGSGRGRLRRAAASVRAVLSLRARAMSRPASWAHERRD